MGIDYIVVVEMLNYLDLMLARLRESNDKVNEIADNDGSLSSYRNAQRERDCAVVRYNDSKDTVSLAVNVTSRGKKHYYEIVIDENNKHHLHKVES